MTARVQVLRDSSSVRALARPVRVEVLDALRTPHSAAGVARAIGQPRQRVSYHLKELERAGLVRHAGERRKGNFIEQLYEAVARRFVVSPAFAWDPERLATALRDQASLRRLVDLGERLQRDAADLSDRAAYEGERVRSATVEAEVRFADDATRASFLREYLAALRPLLKKYGARSGTPFRVAVAAYPDTETGEQEDPS